MPDADVLDPDRAADAGAAFGQLASALDGGGLLLSASRLVEFNFRAVILIAQHPLIGVGGMSRIQAVSEATPDPARNGALIRTYKHLHNFALDEALTSGLIGLALLLSVFASFLVSVWRWSASREVRECALFLPVLVASFGSFHGVLLNEWMLIQIFGTMSVLLTALHPARLPLATKPFLPGGHGRA